MAGLKKITRLIQRNQALSVNIALICAALAIIGVHLWSLMRYPAVYVDEGWLLNEMAGFVKTGYPLGSLDYWQGLEQFPGAWVINRYLYLALYSTVMRFGNEPSLWLSRLMSLITGFGVCYLSYQTINYLKGKTVAVVSTFLLAFSVAFFYSAHMVRYEVFEALLGFMAIYLVVKNPERALWKPLVAGILAAVNMDVHQNAILYIGVLPVILIIQEGRTFLRSRLFWALAGGGVIGLGIFALMHFVPYGETYFGLNSFFYSHLNESVLAGGRWLLSLEKTFGIFLVNWSVMLLLIPVALAGLLRGKSQADRILFWTAVVMLLEVYFIWPKKTPYYTILFAPVIYWVIADWMVNRVKKLWLKGIVMSIVIATLFTTGQTVLAKDFGAEYRNNQQSIQALVQQDDVVMGLQTYWPWLPKNEFYSWESLLIYPSFHPGSTPVDALEILQPDILIIDDVVWGHVKTESETGSFRLKWPDPYGAMVEITGRGTLVGVLLSDSNGEIQVYRFLWDE